MWTHGGVDPPVPGSGWELALMYCKVGFCSTFESNVVTIQCNVKCARLSEGKWVGILSPPGEGGKVTHAPTLMLGMDAPWQRSSSSSSWSILWSSQSCSNLEKKQVTSCLPNVATTYQGGAGAYHLWNSP